MVHKLLIGRTEGLKRVIFNFEIQTLHLKKNLQVIETEGWAFPHHLSFNYTNFKMTGLTSLDINFIF